MPIDINQILAKSKQRKLPQKVSAKEPEEEVTFLDRLADVGKVAGRSALRTVGQLPPTIAETVAREVEVRPGSSLQFALRSQGLGAINPVMDATLFAEKLRQFSRGEPLKRSPFLNAVSNAGLKAKNISTESAKKVEELVNNIEALEPSERAQEILRGGFDPEVLTARNLERAALIFGEAVPSLGVAIGASMLTGSPLIGASLLGVSEGGALAREAEEAGATAGTAQNVAIVATVGNTALEFLPLDFLLKGGKGATGAFFSKIFKRVNSNPNKKAIFDNLPTRMFKGFVRGVPTEGLQETTQQAFSNLVAKLSFDESRNLTQGMVDAFVGGALSGGFAGSSLGALQRIKQDAVQKGVSQEDLETIQASLAAAVIAQTEEIDVKTKQRNAEVINAQPIDIDQDIFDRTIAENGSTTHVQTGQKVRMGDTGFGVSIFPKRNVKIPKENLTPQIVAQFREANKDLLSKPENFLGTYINDDGIVDLDVSVVERNKRKGLQLARKNNQEAIFDYKSGVNIKTEKVAQDVGEAITATDLNREVTLFGQFDKINNAIDSVNTIEDLQTLNDNIDVINEFILDAGMKDQDVFKLQTEVKVKLLSKIIRAGKKAVKGTRIEDLTRVDPITGNLVGIRRIARLMDIVDKTFGAFNGAFSKLFVMKTSIAKDNEIRERINDTEQFIELQKLAGLFPVDMKLDENFFQALKERTVDLPSGRTIMTRLNGEKISLSQAIGFYMVRNNLENTQALIERNGYTQEELNEAINLLTPEQKSFGDQAALLLQKDVPRVMEVVQSTTDRVFDPVTTGYLPMISLDSFHDDLGAQMKEDFEQRVALRNRGIPQGFTKERAPAEILKETGREKRAPIRTGAIELINDYITKKSHYIHFAPLIKEQRAIINHPDFRAAFRDTKQQAILTVGIEAMVNAVAKSDPYQAHDVLGKLIEKTRTNAALAFLGAQLGTMMIQAPSVGLVIPEVGLDPFLGAISEMMQDPAGLIKSVEDQAPQIKQRSFDRIVDIFRRSNPTKWEQIQKTLGAATLSGITAVDKLAVVTVWRSAQIRAEAGGMSEQEANQFATQIVLRTQPAADPKDVPQIFRTRLGSVFSTFQNQLQNLFELTTDAKRRLQGGKIGQGIATMTGVMLEFLAIWILRHQRIPTEEDDLKDFALTLTLLIPLLGSTINSRMKSPYFSGLPAPLFPLEKLASAGSKLIRKEFVGASEDVLEAIGVGAGVPAFTALKRGAEAGFNILTGKETDPRTLFFSKFNITPPSARKKARARGRKQRGKRKKRG